MIRKKEMVEINTRYGIVQFRQLQYFQYGFGHLIQWTVRVHGVTDCTRTDSFFVLYFSGICVKIKNDRLVGSVLTGTECSKSVNRDGRRKRVRCSHG